jgi:thymidylate synthase
MVAAHQYIRAETLAAAWEASLKLFLNPDGLNRYDSRGEPCYEVEDLVLVIKHPDRAPRISPLFPAQFVPLVDAFTDRLLAPQGKGERSVVNGRLFRWRRKRGAGDLNQLETIVEQIRTNPNSRATIMGFWDPEQDLASATPVGPLIAYFRARSGRLNATLVTRSIDALNGATAILVGFAALQSAIALRIGLPSGQLTVLALSYHVHDMDMPRVVDSLGRG